MESLKDEIKYILKCMVVTNSLVKVPEQEKHMINNYADDLVKLCNKHFVVGRSEQLTPLPQNECEGCGVLIDGKLDYCSDCGR